VIAYVAGPSRYGKEHVILSQNNRKVLLSTLAAVLLAGMTALPLTIGASAAPTSGGAAARVARATEISAAQLGRTAKPVCGPVQPGFVRCLELVDKAPAGYTPLTSPEGYGPADLQSAYDLPSATNGTGRTIAVVDAYNDPDAASNLATYRSTYGLPTCTTVSGCFRQVNQSGGTALPADNVTWASEISLDLDMVSATCPNCHILLVEASSQYSTDLGAAEDEAAALHATEISNSYGGPEGTFDQSSDHYYDHPGIAITVGSGDDGYGVNYPAASPYVTAVGGTNLQISGNSRGWTESAWGNTGDGGAGSGCSAYESRPSWQSSNPNITAVCGHRAVADVSAVADPATPVAVYDTYGSGGWSLAGGTSASTPIIAGVFALTSNASALGTGYLYSHSAGLNDVTSGSNGSCGGSALCTSTTGWDGPTGLGTPNGINAFGTGGKPIISAVVPAAGPVAGGQTVTVLGSGFAAGMTATIDGTSVTPTAITAGSFQFVTPAESAGYVQVQATTSIGTSLLTAQTGYIYTALSNYTALATPFRILDTRSKTCIQCTGGALVAGAARTVPITSYTDPKTHENVPPDATAVVINVTAVAGTATSLLAVYPAGTGQPTASNLNFAAGKVIPNLVTATLGESGDITIYNADGTVNVLADVEGYFEPPSSSTVVGEFHAIAPVRVCDTRSTSSTPACKAHGELIGTSPLIVNVTTGAGIANGNAAAAVLNITGIAGSALTFLSVFPTTSTGTCAFGGSTAPSFSTLNLTAGVVEANRVMVGLGPSTPGGNDTSVCVYNAAGTMNVVLDANGWFGGSGAPAGDQYQAIGPSRICDTRTGSGHPCAGETLGPNSHDDVAVAGVGGVPTSASANPPLAIIANLTAIAPTQGTYLSIYPANLSTTPLVSDINVNPTEVIPNLVVVQLDPNAGADDGHVDLYNAAGDVNAVIDVEGWFQ
jgi:IPT/TIG domain-containing protein